MLRNVRRIYYTKPLLGFTIQKQNFLTNEYKCADAWNIQTSSELLQKVNLNDFYNLLEQNYSSKGVISAIDVDVFANTVKEPVHLEELKDLLHKLRLSAETGNTLDSTHHATVRKYLEYGTVQDLVDILKDPLNFGIFLDNYSANILLDKLITSENYNLAANVAALIMLQEEYTNEITISLCQYACYKYVTSNPAPPEVPVQSEAKKPEEIKIRIKYLRNPYFDDHFDIKDLNLLSGKTLAWLSRSSNDVISRNIQIIGWLVYKKYDKLLELCKDVGKDSTFKKYTIVNDLMKQECEKAEEDIRPTINECITALENVTTAESTLEDSLKIKIENAINNNQKKDIVAQQQLFKLWTDIREEKLDEQTKRLDRAKRIQLIEEKQKNLKEEEQKLWFFENQEQIDLEIEEKEKLVDTTIKKKVSVKTDENYIPPEILPKRK